MDEIANTVDPLAERYRAALAKTRQGRAQWIEGTLELAAVVLEARNQYPDHHAFRRWHERNGLRTLTEGERAALLGFARDPVAGRKLLEESRFSTWRGVWESVPKGKQRAPSESGGGAPAPKSRRSGHSIRQRRQRIPDVMRDRPVRPLPNPKFLTREEVDPDFTGTALEFATKYGHVNLHTKEEIEHDKRQAEVAKWTGAVAAVARAADALLALPDPEALAEWLAKPGKAAKLRAWQDAIRRAAERLQPAESRSPANDHCISANGLGPN